MFQESPIGQVVTDGFLAKVEERLDSLEARIKTSGDAVGAEVEIAVKLMKEIRDLVKKREIKNDRKT
jgi:hypothetical protein